MPNAERSRHGRWGKFLACFLWMSFMDRHYLYLEMSSAPNQRLIATLPRCKKEQLIFLVIEDSSIERRDS